MSIDNFEQKRQVADMRRDDISNQAEDPKRAAIIAASFEVCLAYGFRKTSMADVAKAAGMSRPALYQYYPNKEAIFRAACAAMYAQKIEGLRVALQAEGSAQEVFLSAVENDLGPVMKGVLTSPHGAELLSASKSFAPDVIEEGGAKVVALIAAFFAQNGVEEPHEAAEAFEAAKLGLSDGVSSYEHFQRRLTQLAKAFAALLA